MSKTYLAIGLVIVVIIVVVALVLGRRGGGQPTLQEQEAAVSTDTVVYSDNGFSPETIKVKAGTTVNFRNDSSQAFQVSSDPHPIHTGLLGFDSQFPATKGAVYSFTFTKTGRFGYHNHQMPSHTATVIVE